MVRFSIFGIQVEVQPFFWLTMVLIGSGFGRGLTGSSLELLFIALFVIAGFISILVHELGHALTAKANGAQAPYIVLQAFGGYAAYPSGIMNRWQSFLITAGGPAAQLFLALVVYVAMGRLDGLMNPNVQFFLSSMLQVSVFWALLNLVPVIPLDGGQMLNAIMGPKRLKITLWTSVIVGCIFGVLMFYLTRSFLFPVFLGMYAWQAYQLLKQQR